MIVDPDRWTFDAILARMCAEIAASVARGRVPRTVASFSELHGYVDANCYGGLCDDDCPLPCYDDDATDVVNRLQSAADAWIRSGALRALDSPSPSC